MKKRVEGCACSLTQVVAQRLVEKWIRKRAALGDGGLASVKYAQYIPPGDDETLAYRFFMGVECRFSSRVLRYEE
jgi:hypothetical protein